MHYFDYTRNNQEDRELSYTTKDLDFQGDRYFARMIKEHGIEEAINSIAGAFHAEAQTNAASILLGASNPYFIELLRDDETVIEMAKNAAIETFLGI